jgi:hypothetical protein
MWFAVFPTYETMVAQLFAAVLVVGSYYAARPAGTIPTSDSAELVARLPNRGNNSSAIAVAFRTAGHPPLHQFRPARIMLASAGVEAAMLSLNHVSTRGDSNHFSATDVQQVLVNGR